nr:unnamed protein product [Haemonchus contortus]
MPEVSETTTLEPSPTSEVEESATEESLSSKSTSTATTTNTPLAGFRESIIDLDKPDLSRIYRRIFPYMSSDRH